MEFYKKSPITNKEYNTFNVVRILNVKQAAFYVYKGLEILHIELSADKNTEEPVLVFYFDRNESRKIFDEWCTRKEKTE